MTVVFKRDVVTKRKYTIDLFDKCALIKIDEDSEDEGKKQRILILRKDLYKDIVLNSQKEFLKAIDFVRRNECYVLVTDKYFEHYTKERYQFENYDQAYVKSYKKKTQRETSFSIIIL